MKGLIGCAVAAASCVACVGTISPRDDSAEQGDGDGYVDERSPVEPDPADDDREPDDGDDRGDDGSSPDDGADPDDDAGSTDGEPADGGGPTNTIACDESFRTGQNDELRGCITAVGDIRVKYFPLKEGRSVARLAVFLHGDTAGDWTSNYGFWEIVPWALARDVLVIGPLSPVGYDEDPPDMPSYGSAGPAVAAPVAEAIEAFATSFGTRTDDLLYWTVSGGSWFLTSSFLPLMGGRLQGLFAVSCGASEWFVDYAWDHEAATPRDRIKLLFNYGSEDFLLPGEQASVDKFKADGFHVTSQVHRGSAHCDHPIAQPSIAFWEANM
jgi:hypothetical protein